MLSWWTHWRAKDAYTKCNLNFKKSTHLTLGIIPFSASQSLKPWIPFPILFNGFGEESQQSNSIWVAPNNSLIKHSWPLILLSTVQRPTTIYRSKTNSSQLCEEGKDNRVTTPNKRWNTVHVKPCSRVVLGPSVAKTTQQQYPKTSAASTTKKQPKSRVDRQPKLTMKTMETLHSPKIRERQNS